MKRKFDKKTNRKPDKIKTIKRSIALLCMLALLAPICAFATDDVGEPGEGKTPPEEENETTTVSTYNYVEFGSYPQTEIVSKASDSGVYGKDWAKESDYIIDEAIYNTLKNLPDDNWNSSGDTILDNIKYRRIKESDATYSNSGDEEECYYYNWSSSDTYHYFVYEPIKWRILEQDGTDYFLLSETALDDRRYNTIIPGDIPWENCTIRSWLNGYDSTANLYGTDYTSNNFIDTAFSTEEQAKIKTTTIENKDNSKNGTEGGNDTNDKIYLLSEDEIYGDDAVKYGFSSKQKTYDAARQSCSSTYAKAMGTYACCEASYLGFCDWWLRSPGSNPGLAALVQYNGIVDRGGWHVSSKSRGVRPAMHVTFTDDSAIELSRFTVNGTTDLNEIDAGLVEAVLYVTDTRCKTITVALAVYTYDNRFREVQTKTVDDSGYVKFTVNNYECNVARFSAYAVDPQTSAPVAASLTLSE